jgi:hypothetical protein
MSTPKLDEREGEMAGNGAGADAPVGARVSAPLEDKKSALNGGF